VSVLSRAAGLVDGLRRRLTPIGDGLDDAIVSIGNRPSVRRMARSRDLILNVLAVFGAVTAVRGLAMALENLLRLGANSRAAFDAFAYWRAGHAILLGGDIYAAPVGAYHYGVFQYAPPLAIVAAPFSLLPLPMFWLLTVAASVLALRYIAGSWRWAAILLIFPGTFAELLLGNVNLLVAAALVAAVRGRGGFLAVVGLAKLYPFALLPQLWRARRSLRRELLVVVIAVAISVPWLSLWLEWPRHLVANLGSFNQTSPLLYPRLVAAAMLLPLGLILSSGALAALGTVLLSPTLWISTTVVFFAPARLALDEWRGWRDRRRAERG
jgi:hypothetical protein